MNGINHSQIGRTHARETRARARSIFIAFNLQTIRICTGIGSIGDFLSPQSPIQARKRRVAKYRSRLRVAHWVNICCSPFPKGHLHEAPSMALLKFTFIKNKLINSLSSLASPSIRKA